MLLIIVFHGNNLFYDPPYSMVLVPNEIKKQHYTI